MKKKAGNRRKHIDAPLINQKDMKALLDQMKAMVPYYTPEWRFSEKDPDLGSTLFLIVADMLQENIKRLNKVPMINFIAFLNMLNINLLPARSASAYVKFNVGESIEQAIYIPSKTQLSASSPTGEGDVIFETENSLLITPAQLIDAYQVDTQSDCIIHCSHPYNDIDDKTVIQSEDEDYSIFPLTLFDFSQGENLQEHIMYIAHEDVLNIKEMAWIELSIQNKFKKYTEKMICKSLANLSAVEWMYETSEGWIPFAKVIVNDNRILLEKRDHLPIIKTEIHGVNNRWIKCKVQSISSIEEELIQVSNLNIKSGYDDFEGLGGASSDQLFHDDLELDEKGFYPFGKIFAPYSVFYIGSQESFSKKEGRVSIKFQLKHIHNRLHPDIEPNIDWKLLMKKSSFYKPDYPPITISKVAWEYWNGKAWVKIKVSKESEQLFYDPSESEQTVTFICPADIEETFVNSHFNYWIRVRVINVDNLYSSEPIYLSPWLENLRLTYEYQDNFPVQSCLTKNNLEYRDQILNLQNSESVFSPFHRLEGKYPIFYMGFDKPPVKGPISLFFSIQNQKYKSSEIPQTKWQYLSGQGNQMQWNELKTLDDTNHFTRSGTVQFSGPEDFKEATIFGKKMYWIRVTNINEQFLQNNRNQPFPYIKGFYMNCTRVIQQEGINWDVPDKVTDEMEHEYQLNGKHVLNEEVWVDETNHLSEDELNELRHNDPLQVTTIDDSEGNIQKVWVKWRATHHFYNSKPADRHYIMNHSSGRFQFGDGKNGMVPPITDEEQIRVNYKTVRGKEGNVDAFQIQELQSSIPFVKSVFNPEPASGGCNAETLEDAMVRGPKMLKHRGRAVTAEDYEWMAKEAYPHIARVRCLANYNVHMDREIGCMTMVVFQKGGRKDSITFPELKKQMEQFLIDKTANVIAFPENIQVIEPVYLEVSVHVILVVEAMSEVIPTEWEALSKLNGFLDPITGQHDQQGWDIGEFVHSSVFYSLLTSIQTVNYVEKCSMSVCKIEDGKRTEINVNKIGDILHGMICSGEHSVNVKSK